MNVAIFVFDEIQILDFTGPMDVFATAEHLFKPFTVGQSKNPVTTFGGLSINPTYDFHDAPPPDVLIIPGGTVNAELEKADVIQWVRQAAQQAKHVLSICTGAFIAAEAGLLDGLMTTTYHTRLERLQGYRESLKVVRDQRFIDNGKVICAAGISSGIDAAFHLVRKVHGLGIAQKIALDLEFDWLPDSGYARAAFADLRLPSFSFPEDGQHRLLRTEGNRRQWCLEAELTLPNPMPDPSAYFAQQLKAAGLTAIKQASTQNSLLFTWKQSHEDSLESGELSIDFETETSFRYSLNLKP